MTLALVTWPDERLRRACHDVTVFDQALADEADEMRRLMVEHGGIGLAANQVGLDKRMFVTAQLIDGPTVFVNPTFTILKGGIERGIEACLSLPGVHERISRANSITVHAQHVTGEHFRFDIDARPDAVDFERVMLMARCVQHEIDHLNGRTMLDRVSPATRLLVIKSMKRVTR